MLLAFPPEGVPYEIERVHDDKGGTFRKRHHKMVILLPGGPPFLTPSPPWRESPTPRSGSLVQQLLVGLRLRVLAGPAITTTNLRIQRRII